MKKGFAVNYRFDNGGIKLSEAIKHANEIADREGCTECGMQHRQLAAWLCELKEIRAEVDRPMVKCDCHPDPRRDRGKRPGRARLVRTGTCRTSRTASVDGCRLRSGRVR